MKRKYQDLTIEFPLEVDTILDLGMECGYSEHPSFWFKAVVPEEKAQEYIGKITEHTTVKVTYVNKKKNAERVMFRGFAANAKVCFDGTYHVLYVEALAHTAKMDIKKKSRSFFKQGVTYHEIIQAVAKDYPGAVVAENIPSSRKTDMPILQYEETDWEFLKRISAMFEAVVTPDCTKEKIYLTMGIPERESKAKDIKKYEQTTIRDLGECYKDYYEEMTAFSVLSLIEKEKKKKAEEARKKQIKGKLEAKKIQTMGKAETAKIQNIQGDNFLATEEEKEKEKLANDTLKEIEAMIDSGELDISSLGYSKKDLKKLIFNTMTGMDQEDTEKEKKPDAVEKEKGKKAQESSFQELNYTTVAVKTKRYIPLGKRILIDDSELAVTHIEAYTEKEEIFYEYILRWPDAITARYEDNPALAGVSLIGTIKECIGNTVSIALEIDEDDGYEDGKKDYFFTYAIESKDYYCMPVAGAKVHLYFQTGKEWDAIAVHSLRGIEAGGERENKISNPDNRSLSNTTGCSIDLTPAGISMTPDDGNTVELKLGKDGSIDMRAKDFTLTGKNIDLGKGISPEGEEVIVKMFSMSAAEHILLNRCQPNADGEIVPIEDHLAGLFGNAQLYTPGSIYHRTTGAFQPPAISYDESELREQEEDQAEENHQQLTNALVARRKEAKAKFAMGILMAGVGAALMVCTGGMIAPLVGAAMIIFAEAEMQEAQSLKSLAESGDFETPPENALKEMIGEPAYTLIKTGLCVTGSIMIAGPGVLVMGAMNTGIELVMDALSGNLKSWQHYCDTFSKGCLIGAITGPIAGKIKDLGKALNTMQKAGTIGSKTAFAIKFAADYGAQVLTSILNDMANGTMSFGSIAENAFREFISLGVASLPSNINCNTRAILNGIADGGAEAFIQLIRDGKVDVKQVLQTAGMSALMNRMTSCDPVDCAKGNFLVYRDDYTCEDLYGSWGFHRRYSSILDYTGAMGKGWMFEYESFLMTVDEVSEESDLPYGLQAMMPDTHVERFEHRKGEWVNLRGNTKEVTLTEDRISRQYSLTSYQGGNYVQYIYDSRGRLTQISEDACSSRATRITYIGETEQIEKIISPGGRTLKFGYERDKIVSIQDETGRELRYEYKGSYLTSASYPTGGKQTYIYDREGRIETMDGWDGREFLTNQYDKKGRVTSQTYPDGNTCTIEYDDRHNETWFTFSDTGRWEHYYSDDMEHVVRTERGTGEKAKEKIKELQKKHGNRTIETMEAIKDMEGITVEEAYYDERGNKLWETDKNGNRHTWEYNDYGQVIKEEQADGLVTKTHYDASHCILKTEDSSGRKTEYQYNKRNQRKEKEIRWLSKEETAETRYTYDRYGRLLTRTDALGNTEEYSYDEGSCHNPLYYTAADGTEFSYTLDSMGRTASITSPYGTVKLTHSDTGEIVRTEDALGNVTEKMVDAIGNVIKLIPPNAYKGNMGGEEAFRYRYDYLDRLIETKDPYGTIHRTIVDMDGNITKEIHPESYNSKTDDGEGVTYTYDADQNRITRTRPDGGTTRYKYDKNGNLIKVIQPEQYNKEKDDGEGMGYTYDAENRLSQVLAPDGSIVRSYTYDKVGNLIEEGDAKGSVTYYEYNYVGWLIKKWEPAETKEGEILYNLTCYSYDRAGNKTEEKRGRKAVKKGHHPLEWLTLTFTYDKRNRLVKVEDSLGAAMEYTYDCLNNKTSEKARINETTCQYTRYEYDAAGRLIKAIQTVDREDVGMEPNRYAKKEFLTTTYEYDKNGNVTRIVTPEGYEIQREYDLLDRMTKETHIDRQSGIERSTEYTYDKAGNLITETDGRGSIERTYNLLNQMIKETDREGGITRYFYDKNGSIVKAVQPDNYNETIDNGEGYTFTYDSMGRLESVRNALGYLEEQNEYDANGNLIRKKDALGTLVEYTYDIANRQKHIWTGEAIKAKEQAESPAAGNLSSNQTRPSQSYTYDARGNITGITDGEGNQTRYDLDAWGRITTIHKPDGSRETYTYDYAGNVTSTTDGNGNKIQYHFNSMNQLKEIVDQNGEKETYTYDSQGRMAGHTNRNGVHTTYGYTIDNQLRYKKAEQLKKAEEHTIRSRKTVPIKQENRYQYNQLGQLTEASGGGVIYNYTYTPNGNVKDKLVNGENALSYNYTSSGRVAGIQDKTGKKVTYQYDKAGKVVSIKDNAKLVAEYSYYEDGTQQKVRFANGIETEYTYDADKNYRSITTKTAEGETLLEYTYQYDGNGNRTQKIGAEYVTKYNGNDSSIGTTSYLYDSLQRVQEVKYPTGTVEQYQYDQAGNRVLKKYGTAENFKTGSYLEEHYTYDNRNRLLERNNPQNVTYYQYDNQGNTVSELTKRYLKPETTKVQNGGTTTITNRMAQTEVEQYKTYEYDSFNKSAQTVVEKYKEGGKETHIQRNFYDAENLRYGIEEDGERTNFVTNGWSVFTELDAEWKPTKRLVKGYGIVAGEECGHEVEESIITEPKVLDQYHFYHQNEHGDTEYITGSNGKVTNAYTYDVFGTITKSSESVKNRYTYNGEQYDQISQQYYLRARNYNPLIGRFTQEDVYRGDGLNLYVYCGNNPVMYVDPSGYSFTFPSDIYMPGTDVDTYVDPSRVDYDKAGIKRTSPGIVTGNFTSSIDIDGSIFNADKSQIAIPKDVAESLIGKKYDNFTEFRKDFWKAMSKSSYASEFDKSNIWAMENGYAPKVRDKNLYSKRFGKVYNLDHIIEIQDGGYVYDLDNISILAPKTHEDKTNAENAKRKKC